MRLVRQHRAVAIDPADRLAISRPARIEGGRDAPNVERDPGDDAIDERVETLSPQRRDTHGLWGERPQPFGLIRREPITLVVDLQQRYFQRAHLREHPVDGVAAAASIGRGGVNHVDQKVCVSNLFELATGKRPAEELYDLSKDPGELRNVAADWARRPMAGRFLSRAPRSL